MNSGVFRTGMAAASSWLCSNMSPSPRYEQSASRKSTTTMGDRLVKASMLLRPATTQCESAARQPTGSFFKSPFSLFKLLVKKHSLVIPIDRLEIVDCKLPNDTNPHKFSAFDMVLLIHKAAHDPNIDGVLLTQEIHGLSKLDQAGWANLEQVRDALVYFSTLKGSIAYCNTLSGSATHKDYYLASAAHDIMLPQSGQVDVLGLHESQVFYGNLLASLNCKVLDTASGPYKCALKQLTETGYTDAHRENELGVLQSIQNITFDEITTSRGERLTKSAWFQDKSKTDCKQVEKVDNSSITTAARAASATDLESTEEALMESTPHPVWKCILDTGCFNAASAVDAGLTDCVADGCLRRVLVGKGLDLSFVTLAEYVKKSQRTGTGVICRLLSWLAAAPARLLSWFWPRKKETVFVLSITGAIDSHSARLVLDTLRAIPDDTKAIVLSIDSPGGEIDACEVIRRELAQLEIPVVVSIGNNALSGGYYIAACANRIFACKKSKTGSIGTFMTRFDAAGANVFGITFDNVKTGELSGLYDWRVPLTCKMKRKIDLVSNHAFIQFKCVVRDCRAMTDEQIEALATGRVWTGVEAVENGLVDELGGVLDALVFAHKTYTNGDAATIRAYVGVNANAATDNPVLKSFLTVHGGISKEVKTMECGRCTRTLQAEIGEAARRSG